MTRFDRRMTMTTSGNVEGRIVAEYLGIISAQIVAGTGLFLDVVAEFSDIFGGKSATYQRRLEAIQSEALRVLAVKAKAIKANAIIGVRIDHDEISGKGKQMFMVTVSGTAVLLAQSTEHSDDSDKIITMSEIEDRAKLLELLGGLENDMVDFSDETLELLLANRQFQYSEKILDAFLAFAAPSGQNWVDSRQYRFCVEYFGNAPIEIVEPLLYSKIVKAGKAQFLGALIKDCNLLNFDNLFQLLKSEDFRLRQSACRIIVSGAKRSYNSQDVKWMREIVEYADSLENSYSWTSEKPLFGRDERQIWLCKCSKSNNRNQEYCIACGKDKFGLEREAGLSDVVEKLSLHLEAFESLQSCSP